MSPLAKQHRHGILARAVTLALTVGFAVVGITGSAGADDTKHTECPTLGASSTYGDDCEPTTVEPPVVPVIDPCGPDNATYGTVPDGPWTAELNPDGSLTLTSVLPNPIAGREVPPKDYRFTFAFDGGL